MALPTSALVYGPKDVQGYWSHSNIQYLEGVVAGGIGVIVEDVDPRVFEQWCNNVWEMVVNRTQIFEYSGFSPPVPTDTFTDSRTFYRTRPDSSDPWTTEYPRPQIFYQSGSDAYELQHPFYLPNPDPPNDDMPLEAPDCTFYVKDGRLKCVVLPTLFTDLDSFTLTPDSITIESSRTIDYSGGTRTETSTLIATITRRFYEPTP